MSIHELVSQVVGLYEECRSNGNDIESSTRQVTQEFEASLNALDGSVNSLDVAMGVLVQVLVESAVGDELGLNTDTRKAVEAICYLAEPWCERSKVVSHLDSEFTKGMAEQYYGSLYKFTESNIDLASSAAFYSTGEEHVLLTCVCREVGGQLPLSSDPFIYTVTVSPDYDRAQVEEAINVIRADEVEYESKLRVYLAFRGELSVTTDFRE